MPDRAAVISGLVAAPLTSEAEHPKRLTFSSAITWAIHEFGIGHPAGTRPWLLKGVLSVVPGLFCVPLHKLRIYLPSLKLATAYQRRLGGPELAEAKPHPSCYHPSTPS